MACIQQGQAPLVFDGLGGRPWRKQVWQLQVPGCVQRALRMHPQAVGRQAVGSRRRVGRRTRWAEGGPARRLALAALRRGGLHVSNEVCALLGLLDACSRGLTQKKEETVAHTGVREGIPLRLPTAAPAPDPGAHPSHTTTAHSSKRASLPGGRHGRTRKHHLGTCGVMGRGGQAGARVSNACACGWQ